MDKRIYLCLAHMSGKEMGFIQEAFDTNWVVPLGPLSLIHIYVLNELLYNYYLGRNDSIINTIKEKDLDILFTVNELFVIYEKYKYPVIKDVFYWIIYDALASPFVTNSFSSLRFSTTRWVTTAAESCPP